MAVTGNFPGEYRDRQEAALATEPNEGHLTPMAAHATALAIDPDLPPRLAAALAQVEGVASAVVAGEAGGLSGGETPGEARSEAALAAFIVSRARSLAGGDDLRGMGRQLIGSHILKVALSGPAGEFLVMPYAAGSVFVTTARGYSPEIVAGEVATTLQRYS